MLMYSVLVAYFFMWYLLIVMMTLFFLAGLEDLVSDLFFWWQFFRQNKPDYAQMQEGHALAEQWIAVMLPCWHEENVIAQMLINNALAIEYTHYYFFVGVYPNDPDTIQAVTHAAASYPCIQCVIGRTPGPSNKAANLNEIY